MTKNGRLIGVFTFVGLNGLTCWVPFALGAQAALRMRGAENKQRVTKGYVRSIQEAFQLYLGDDKSCFVPGEPFPVAEALDIIHGAGGKAFVAHPHLYQNANLIRDVLILPFDIANKSSSANGSDNGVQVDLMWEIVYIILGCLVVGIIPFAFFFFTYFFLFLINIHSFPFLVRQF